MSGEISVENRGIDPLTYRMRSGRSTIWANSPYDVLQRYRCLVVWYCVNRYKVVSLHFLVKLSIAYCAKCTKSPSICWDTATLKYQKIDKISKYRFYIVQNILVLRILVCLFRQWMLLDTMSWVPFWCRRVMKWLTQNSSLKLPIRRTASLCTSKMHQNDAFWKRYRITRFWIVRLNRVGVRIMAQSHRNVRWLDTRAGDRLNGQCCIVSVVCSLGVPSDHWNDACEPYQVRIHEIWYTYWYATPGWLRARTLRDGNRWKHSPGMSLQASLFLYECYVSQQRVLCCVMYYR